MEFLHYNKGQVKRKSGLKGPECSTEICTSSHPRPGWRPSTASAQKHSSGLPKPSMFYQGVSSFQPLPPNSWAKKPLTPLSLWNRLFLPKLRDVGHEQPLLLPATFGRLENRSPFQNKTVPIRIGSPKVASDDEKQSLLFLQGTQVQILWIFIGITGEIEDRQ